MSSYEGKYFKDRDFYDYGIDYELLKLREKFNEEIDQLKFYRRTLSEITQFGSINFKSLPDAEMKIIECYLENATIDDLEKIMHSHRDDVREEFSWISKIEELEEDLEERDSFVQTIIVREYMKQLQVHNKMCFVNAYTILDDYLNEIIKVFGMYLNDFLIETSIKISYKQLNEFDNKTDLREHFVDSIMISDRNMSGAFSKVKYLLKHLNLTNNDMLNEIKIFNEERNCIAHNRGLYNKKSIKNIGETLVEKNNLKIDSKVILNNKKVDSSIFLIKETLSYFIDIAIKEFCDTGPINLDSYELTE
ncbi:MULTISPECIES: hypothetical protein [Paenibacillus]|jgi:hypothetical protein|uniref:hypothetical protein n=1 Tax=Paenibacillus TaxID=44249 RepID=UPI00096D146B|nr:hypothetical protein [Paenibacillus odorifer]OMD97177.1 hypothetical protein BSK67_03690 [Paenibacillus odorifer]